MPLLTTRPIPTMEHSGGTNSAVPTWGRTGVRGGAYGSGVDDYIAVPYLDFITIPEHILSQLGLVTKGPGAGQSETIFQNAKPDDRNGMNVVNNEVRFGYYDSAWSGKSSSISPNVWTHVVGVNNAGTLSFVY